MEKNNKQQLLKTVSYPAIFEKDKEDNSILNIWFLDLPCIQTFARGINEAFVVAPLILKEALKYKHFREVIPTPAEELHKLYPNKKFIAVNAPLPTIKTKTSYNNHYLVIKIVKTNCYDFDVKNVEEIRNALDKVVLFCALLKHADSYNENKNHNELQKLLYDFKEVLIKEYASKLFASEQQVKDTINSIIEKEDCFYCCNMFNMCCSCDMDDCMCGFYSYKTIKKQLDELNCFDDMEKFAKDFLSIEYKIIGLKLEYTDENKWDYINE